MSDRVVSVDPASAPAIERVRAVRERLVASGSVRGADGRSRQLFPVAIDPDEGRALRGWVLREGAQRTLETGLGFAISTLFIFEGLLENGPDGLHVAADPFQFEGLPTHQTTYVGAGLDILKEAGVRDRVEFYDQESQIVLPRLLAEGREFDLAFLDGNHRFEGIFLDLIYSGRLVKPGGVVFVDDLQILAVRRAVTFCVTNLGWKVEDEGTRESHAWCVLRTGPREVFVRPFEDFVDF